MRMRFFWRRGLLLAMLLLFCSVLAARAQETGPKTVELRVMTFNVWVGGELVDFNQVVEAIKAARADIVGLQEAGGSAEEDGLMWLPPYEASFFGSVSFGSGHLEPGLYEAVLVGAEGEEVSRSQFWLVDPAGIPTVSAGKTSYKAGEAISVTWDNAPANRWDWLAIYAAGDPDLYNGYWGYAYTKASPTGEATFDSTALGDEMLPPGKYELRLMLDDVYIVLGTSSFTVTE